MNKVAKSTCILILITILSKCFGFIRETTLVSIHGASSVTDAYITAMNIPSVMFATIASALATTFIPLFFDIRNKEGETNSLKFSNNVFNIVVILSLILASLGFIFAKPIIKVFAMNFKGEQLILATNFAKIMMIGTVFIGLNNILSSWLQIKENFIIPGIIGIPYNLIIILFIIISSKNNVYIMVIGTIIATIVQFIIQFFSSYKTGFRYSIYLNLKDKNIKKMISLIVPVFIGVGVAQLNTVVDKSLASTLGNGMITILNSANRLDSFVSQIFVANIITVLYPLLSMLSIENDKTNFSLAIKKSINSIIIITIPISVVSIILSEPIVRLVFERGQFNSKDTILTSQALACYSIGMCAFGVRALLNKIFYSLKDTKTPMINGTITVLLNILLNIVFIKFMGHIGLALATSISSILCTVLMFKDLKKLIKGFNNYNTIYTLIKSLVASIFMGTIVKLVYTGIIAIGVSSTVNLISIGISILIGSIIYILVLVILRVDEIKDTYLFLLNKIINLKLNKKVDAN